jgi:WD40 repeat protein
MWNSKNFYSQIFMMVKFHVSLFSYVLFFITLNISHAQYKLEKVKEFQINSLNSIDIVDYDPKQKRYLGVEKTKGFVVIILDEKGNILQRKNLEGQGPGQFRTAINCLGYSDENGIWILTPNQVLYFNYELNFHKERKIHPKNMFYVDGLTEPISYFYRKTTGNSLAFIPYPSSTSLFVRPQDFRNENLIEIYDSKLEKSYYLAPVADRPLSQKLDKSLNAIYKPIFSLDRKNDKLFVTASLDNEITVIDVQSGKTLSKIKINHDEFKSIKMPSLSAKTLSSYNQYTLTSLNRKLLHLDNGLLVLNYVREIPYGTFEQKIGEDKTYHHFRDPDYHRLIIFDQEKQLSEDLQIPYGEIKISLPGNSILIKLLNPEEEEDFIRYGIFELVRN